MNINHYLFHKLPLVVFVVLFCVMSAHSAPFAAMNEQSETISDEVSPENVDTNALLASLSDEQVRQLLIKELQKAPEAQDALKDNSSDPGAFFGDLVNTLSDKSDSSEEGLRQLLSSFPEILPDLDRILLTLCPYGTHTGAIQNILWVLFFISVGFLIELLFKQLIAKKLFHIPTGVEAHFTLSLFDKLMASIVKEAAHFLGIIIFFVSAYIVYFTFIWTESPFVQTFFLSLLIGITFIRLVATVCRILLFPDSPAFRILPMSCTMAGSTYKWLVWSASYIVLVMLCAVILRKLGAQSNTVSLFFLLASTILLSVTAFLALLFRKTVKTQIISSSEIYGEHASWGRKQFASIWHLLAIAYIIGLWILSLNGIVDPERGTRGAFIMSFFVVPIWMVCDKLLQWLVKYAMATLRIHQDHYEETTDLTEEDIAQRIQGKQTLVKVMMFSRTVLVFGILTWIASLWNITIPIFSNLSSIIFDTLIILTLAILFWQFISNWIERKIQESLPDDAENEEEDDNEWGGAAKRGRSYTLLPMLRKFIGTILITMVTMTILSSMGVDIGPLLAGAGVVGLAVGFGAQKLVADMFSGFFYLLDDAFRVGEYVEAGGISGTVENISLRNVMLRHHRGMLQIVPHSELGAITNFMRGGIVVKFNLDFPYDAHIDQIRKVIKKVGQAMMAEEEFSKDFIRPIKSQGVREITNSVMTIRVKFTANPGAHFLIRREAYKRITEALRAKGINYAHRKVIVDIPQQADPATQENIVKAAGAATQEVLDAEQNQTLPTKPVQDIF